MQTKYKKVLIVSHNALSLHANNGKTLTSLFKDWPAENIAQLYVNDELPETNKFLHFFRIREIDILKVLFGMKKSPDCGEVILPKKHLDRVKLNSSWLKDIIKITLKDYLQMIRNIVYATNVWRSEKMTKWVLEFQPDVIFFVGGDAIFSFKIAMWLANYFKIQFYVYLTDDYVINKKPSNIIQKWRNNSLIKCYKKAFDEARGLFVIGTMMALEFEKFFGRKFYPIMNTIEFANDTKPIHIKSRRSEICIVYAGGLHLNRWKMIVEFGRLINKCSQLLEIDIYMEIYCAQMPASSILRQLTEPPLSYKGKLSGSGLTEKLASAEFLLHVESYEEKYRQFTKLSVSTKISEYLASGTCVIGYGPAEVASMKLLSDNQIGITITDIDNDSEKIKKLVKIFSDDNLRKQYEKRGFNYAFDNFNANKTRLFLKDILCAQFINVDKSNA